jgi:hypothetical protein
MDQKVAYWMSGYTAAAQPFCDEPLLAAQTFQGAGGFSSGVKRGLFGPLIGRRARDQAEDRAGGLPDMVLLAIGPTKVFVFAYKTSGTQLALEPPVRTWARPDVEVESDARRVASKLTIAIKSTGDRHELESTSMTGRLGKMTLEMFRLLADPNAS